jgi:hypothetical protein
VCDIVLQLWIGLYVTVADWLYIAIHNFSQPLLSELQVLLFMVIFDATLSAAKWYILHTFTGGL